MDMSKRPAKSREARDMWDLGLQLKGETCKHNEGEEMFVLHDGPPLGHVMNKVVKDGLVKFKRLKGYHCPFVPGWDCHGLPIEHKVATSSNNELSKVLPKELLQPAAQRAVVEPALLRTQCRAYAQHWVDVQQSQFQSLGVLADWEHAYHSMDKNYEADTLRVFGRFVEAGLVSWKLKTVPWCASCQTTLSKSEMEYCARADPSCYVAFHLTPDSLNRLLELPELVETQLESVSLVAWTTTPWTLPFNKAVVLSPRGNYVLVKSQDPQETRVFVVGETECTALKLLLKLQDTVVCKLPATSFKGLSVNHPLLADNVVPVLLDNMVDLEEKMETKSSNEESKGPETEDTTKTKQSKPLPTGVVHLAPSCGPEDYKVGVAYGLETEEAVTADGRYTENVFPAFLRGMKVSDAKQVVLEALKENLVTCTTLVHEYPHCWRCKQGLVFRATHQWFCSLHTSDGANSENFDLVSRAVASATAKMRFFPPNTKSKFVSTLLDPHDWCLSRQRHWGVPLVALHCLSCSRAYVNREMVEHVASKMETEGLEWWWSSKVSELGELVKCPSCGNDDPDEFRKEKDVLDVWFDSGSSNVAVLQSTKYGLSKHPCDVYFEGKDQHRGWFQSSLFCSMVTHNDVPCKNLLTHGFLVDELGRKFSKSLGNGLGLDQVLKLCSGNVDVVRLWACSCDWSKDVKCTTKSFEQATKKYRQVRGLFRFLLANLMDFDFTKNQVAAEMLPPMDQCVLAMLKETTETVLTEVESFNLHAATQELLNFCQFVGSFYLERAKMCLYFETPDSPQRRATQTTCYFLLSDLVRLLSPVLSFMAEEVYQLQWKNTGNGPSTTSVHLQSVYDCVSLTEEFSWVNVAERLDGFGSAAQVKTAWQNLLKAKQQVSVVMEENRGKAFRDSFQTQLQLVLCDSKEGGDVHNLLLQFNSELSQSDFFLVSKFNVTTRAPGDSPGNKNLVLDAEVRPLPTEVQQCLRCRRYNTVATTPEEDVLCTSCQLCLD